MFRTTSDPSSAGGRIRGPWAPRSGSLRFVAAISILLLTPLSACCQHLPPPDPDPYDPLVGRYEPYAAYYMNTAVPYTQQVVLNGDVSTDALMACYCATVSSQEFNRLWAVGYMDYVAGLNTYDDHLATVVHAGALAFQACLYEYQVYIARPSVDSQVACAWCYYGARAAYLALGSPDPGHHYYLWGSTELLAVYVKAFYSGRHLSFLSPSAKLSRAAYNHSLYMAQNDLLTEVEVHDGVISTTLDIIEWTGFLPTPGTDVGVVLFKSTLPPNSHDDAFLSQFYTPTLGSAIGIGVAHYSDSPYYYYCIYVATKGN